MRKAVLLLAAIVPNPAAAADLAPWQAAAIQELTKMKATVEVLFPQNATGSLWLSVRDDGSRRDGLAQAVCLDLGAAGRPEGQTTVIHIWDAAAMARGEMTELGQAIC